MTTDLVTARAQGLAAFTGRDNPFSKAADDAGVSSGKRLNFNGKSGEWSVGKNPTDDGHVFAFDMYNARYVWTAWKAKKPVEMRTYSIVGGERVPDVSELTDHWGDAKRGTDGWSKGILLTAVDPDVGEDLDATFKADSPYRPILRLLKEFGEKFVVNLDDNNQPKIPLIEIGSDSFISKQSDEKLYAPVLNIVGWISVSELDAIREASEAAEGVAEAVSAPAPAPKSVMAPAGVKPALRVGKRV